MREVLVESNEYKGISYNLYLEQGKADMPLILICHGFSNDKLEGSSLALRLAWRGFAVACFDLYNQGDRYNGFLDRITSDCEFGRLLFNIIEQSEQDIVRLLSVFHDDARIDSSRIGLTGFSLGANLCFYTMSKNKNIRTVVPILGAPDFVKLIVDGMEKNSIDDFITAEEKSLMEYVVSLNPVEYLIEQESRPMMIINANKDDEIPFEFSKEFYELTIKRYKEIEGELEFIVEDGFHVVTDSMMNNAIEWFAKHLQKG